ncbi:hypothetical protein [Streptosporangium sp. NPDC002721]|uniref:hypothetical protein n=1 Tax=Streptosporangium sp. NPDC002721 TaxID=3366188 RepID=UPI0036CE8816
MRKLAVRFTCLLTLGAGIMPASGTALAATPALAPSGTTAASHCVADRYGKGLGCYSSLSRAIRVANAAGYAVAVLYDWVNYDSRGDTVTISVPRDCSRSTSGKADYEFKRLDHMGWGDRVSSVNTRLGNGTRCDVFFHTDIDLVQDCAGKRWIDKYGHLGHYGCYKRASSFRLS